MSSIPDQTLNQSATILKTAYPARYYAAYDTHAPQPTIVRGWYDVWGMSDLTHVPPAQDMMPLTEEEWEEHFSQPEGYGIQDGKLIAYTQPPAPPLPLSTQATTALGAVQQHANMVASMGETFGPQMRLYVQKLRAIINGSDTTSTKLPAAPSDPTT